MQVFIEEINQVLSLRDGQMHTRLSISLPSGDVILATISEDDLKKVTNEMPDMQEAPAEQEQQTEDISPDVVEWALLPDEELPEFFKVTLGNLGVPAILPLQELLEYVAQISAAAAVDERMEAAQPAPQDMSVKAPAPAGPVVGRVVMNQGKPRRTVPTDERGYPVVPGLEASDSNEVLEEGDEDGVSSI